MFIRVHSWLKTAPPFVFIRGSKPPLQSPLRLSVQIRVHPWRNGPVPPWPRACSGNTINRSRAGKPELHQFVFIRVHSWLKNHPCIRVHSWLKTATAFVSIRSSKRPLHSCPFVVPNQPCIPLCDYPCKSVLIRGEMAPCPSVASNLFLQFHQEISGWKARATFIRVHSWFKNRPCIRIHSWFQTAPAFVSIRGSKPTLHSPLRLSVFIRVHPWRNGPLSLRGLEPVLEIPSTDLGLESPSYIHSCSFVSIRG